MLSESMAAELCYAGAMLVYGYVLAACYHPLVFIRTMFRHTIPMVDAEDILFFSAAGVGFFLVAYRMNDGILRWYAFAGCALGAYVYYRTLARLLECVRKWLLQRKKKAYKIKGKRRKNGAEKDEGSAGQSKTNQKEKEDGS